MDICNYVNYKLKLILALGYIRNNLYLCIRKQNKIVTLKTYNHEQQHQKHSPQGYEISLAVH